MYPTRSNLQVKSRERITHVPEALPYLRNTHRRKVMFPRRRIENQSTRRLLFTGTFNDPPSGAPAMVMMAN